MTVRIINADVMEGLRQLPDESVHCVVTSPPYWGLRDYGVDGQIGLEATPEAFVARMVEVFREVRRVLRADGTCWVNLGDSYSIHAAGKVDNPMAKSTLAGVKTQEVGNASSRALGTYRKYQGLPEKNLIGIPWRVAFALQADGWWLRSDIIWAKPNPMPESVTDRPTKAHEYVFLLTKSERYFYDAEAIKEPATYDGPNSPGTQASPYGHGFTRRAPEMRAKKNEQQADRRRAGFNARWDSAEDSGAAPLSRNKRTVWTVATAPFSEAHFATFPPDLIEPMILSGTSQHGSCAGCGAPWKRNFERELVPTAKAAHTFVVDERDAIADRNDQGANRQKDGHKPGWAHKTTTLGWLPSCDCNAGVVPCTVLDPFGGAGTTGMVADRLQRNAILIELNPEYAAMAKRRLEGDAPLFAEVQI